MRELRDWDLWGPLILCLLLSVCVPAAAAGLLRRLHPRSPLPSALPARCSILSVGAQQAQQSLVFASVFVIVWAGAAVVTANAQLLGGNM